MSVCGGARALVDTQKQWIFTLVAEGRGVVIQLYVGLDDPLNPRMCPSFGWVYHIVPVQGSRTARVPVTTASMTDLGREKEQLVQNLAPSWNLLYLYI